LVPAMSAGVQVAESASFALDKAGCSAYAGRSRGR
jgi:hypothetical protein